MIGPDELNEAQFAARESLFAALIEWGEAFIDRPETFRAQVSLDGTVWNLSIGAES